MLYELLMASTTDADRRRCGSARGSVRSGGGTPRHPQGVCPPTTGWGEMVWNECWQRGDPAPSGVLTGLHGPRSDSEAHPARDRLHPARSGVVRELS